MRRLVCLLLGALLALAPARAQQASPEPAIAPVPAWVRSLEIPAPNPALRDRPAQTLLLSSQSLYGAEAHDHFTDLAFVVQNAQGLQALGNIVLPWRPDQGELIIHKVQIVRGGTVVDLLANGQRFAVLRRENNLESAMLDGMLTAVMQPEGLAVGDILHLAFTQRRRPSALPLRGENFYALAFGVPIRRAYLRQIWPAGMAMHWRGSGILERARTRATRLGTELELDLTDAEGPQPPERAPSRLAMPAMLQISQFRDWAEVSASLATHYAQAATLGASSPLRREIARIAGASADPRVRAMAALRLVQDQVRYFALVMGDGNYLPAAVDQSWARRFADCKGKVAMLLALLRELGIEAEPVLVNTDLGDGLNDRLPGLSTFNHVIVRARIDGRSYWLDGTRGGDRNLDDLASSVFVWGLPVRAAGATLEALPYAPSALPIAETNTTLDGSGGFTGSVPFRIERIMRGDLATSMRVALSAVGRDEFLRQLRQNETALPGEGGAIESVDLRDDPDSGAFTVVVSGRTGTSWVRAPGTASQRFRFSDSTIEWDVDFDRPAGPFRDAPFAFPVPAYFASTETVILPAGGAGFSIEGESFDHLVAGTQISRRLSIAGGRAVSRSEFKRLEREVSAQSARTSTALITTINEDHAYLRAAMGVVRPAAAPAPAGNAARPASAEALVHTGFQKMGQGRLRPALADFESAIALAPQWSLAHADRGIALLHLNRLDEAEAALRTALRLDDTEFAAHQGMGFVDIARGRPEAAIPALTRSLELQPENTTTMIRRGEAYLQLGRFDDALADLDRVLAAAPGHAVAHAYRARILVHRGRGAEAVAAADRAVAADPGNFLLAGLRGEIFARAGRPEEAAAAYRSALEMFERMTAAVTGDADNAALSDPRVTLLISLGRHAEAIAAVDAGLRRYAGNVMMLASRCRIRVETNGDLGLARRDCDQALQAEPGHPVAQLSRAFLNLRTDRWADAIRDFEQVLAGEPRSPLALYGRGVARARSGDIARGQADVATARRLQFDIDWEFERRGTAAPPRAAAETATAAPAS